MKSISVVCPNCVTPLVANKKLLGAYVNWYVCPCCGYRERPSNESTEIAATGRTIDRLKFRNSAQLRPRKED